MKEDFWPGNFTHYATYPCYTSTKIWECAITEVSFGKCWCAKKYPHPFFCNIHPGCWQQQSAASFMCCLLWRICTNGPRIESAPSDSSTDKFNKHSVDINRTASLLSPHFTLHFALWEGEMVSSVNKDNSNTIVKTLGQVLLYCISGENTSVDVGKCYIARDKTGKKYKPEPVFINLNCFSFWL